MELIVVLLLIGGGAYWVFRGNVQRGAEIMRANIFLTALEKGHSVLEANGLASAEMSDLPPEFVHMANRRASRHYQGARLAMVADAYRHGMQAKLSKTEIASIQGSFGTAASAAGSSSNSPQHGAAGQADFPTSYEEYYRVYISELKRLSGTAADQHHQAELMEEIGEATGDNLTRQNFVLGVDPKEYAAAVHAVMQRNQPTSDFTDFDSYFAAYVAELKSLSGLGAGELHAFELMNDDGARLAFRDGVPPQTLAAMVHEHELARQPG